MTKAELNDMISKLYHLAEEDGDLGAAYWNEVIEKLIAIRNKTL